MRQLHTLYALLLVLIVAPTGFAQPIYTFTIDNFANTQNTSPAIDSVSDTAALPHTAAAFSSFGPFPTSNTVGGYRTLGNLLLDNSSNPAGPYGSTEVSNNLFRVNNDSNIRSAGQIIWSGTNTNPASGQTIPGTPSAFSLGLDVPFQLSGQTNFFFDFSVVNRDNRTWTYTVRAYTDATNYFEKVLTTSQGANGFPPAQVISILNTDFTAINNPSWNSIGALSFSASYSQDQGLSADLSLDFIRFASVPEPGTIALFAVTGFFGLQWYLRRKPAEPKKTLETDENNVADAELVSVQA
jgi:hypothetical protein